MFLFDYVAIYILAVRLVFLFVFLKAFLYSFSEFGPPVLLGGESPLFKKRLSRIFLLQEIELFNSALTDVTKSRFWPLLLPSAHVLVFSSVYFLFIQGQCKKQLKVNFPNSWRVAHCSIRNICQMRVVGVNPNHICHTSLLIGFCIPDYISYIIRQFFSLDKIPD